MEQEDIFFDASSAFEGEGEASCLKSSEELRSEGNEWFLKARSGPPGLRQLRLNNALSKYLVAKTAIDALDQDAARNAEEARINKNLAATYSALFEAVPRNHDSLVLSVHHNTLALKFGNMDPVFPEAWLEGISSSLLTQVGKVFSLELVHAEKLKVLRAVNGHLREVSTNRFAKPSLAVSARATFNAAVVATDYIQDAKTVTSCDLPKQLLMESNMLWLPIVGVRGDEMFDCTFAEGMLTLEKIVESTRLRLLGEKEIEEATRGSEDLDIERVWQAVDFLKNSSLESRGFDLEAEARTSEALGRVFEEVLLLKDLARKYYTESVSLALAASPRSFEKAAWFQRAMEAAERHQRIKAQITEEEELKKKRNVLERLEPVLTPIKTANEQSWQELLKHLYTQVPPAPSKLQDFKLPTNLTADNGKKMIMKGVFHYHPDKQSKEVIKEMQGFMEALGAVEADWVPLCEEIVKLLNVRFELFK